MGAPLEHPSPSTARALRGLQIVVAIVAVTYLAQLLEWAQVRAAIERANGWWFVLAYALQLPLLAGLVLRWRVVLRGLGHKIPVPLLSRWYLSFFLYSCVLPGTLGGDVVRGGACSRHTGATHAATSILTERLCGMTSVLLLGPLGVLLLTAPDRQIFGDPLLRAIHAVGVAVVLLGALLWTLRRWRPPSTWFTVPWQRLRRVWVALEEVLMLRTSSLAATLTWSGAAQFVDMLSMYALALALDLSINLPVLVVLVPVTYVVTLVPISLGGLGIREGVTVYFLAQAGISASDATLLALLVFSTKAALGVLGGVLEVARPSTRTTAAEVS